jgi:nucleoside-diphosphate-sugar epimerase
MALSGGNHWAFSNALARARLDWTPRPLDEGLAEVMRWYRHRR